MKPNNNVVVYIPTYHDFRALSKAIDNNIGLGLKTIVGIGRFKGFPDLGHDVVTTDFCKQNNIHWFEHIPMYEECVLNIAFTFAHRLGYKILLLLGSDCWLEGNVDTFHRNLTDRVEDKADIFKLKIIEHQPDDKFQQKQSTQPMVYYRFDELEGRWNHWLIYRKDSKYVLRPKNVIEGLVLHHDTSIRSKERNTMMEEYQTKNVEREQIVFQKRVKGYKFF